MVPPLNSSYEKTPTSIEWRWWGMHWHWWIRLLQLRGWVGRHKFNSPTSDDEWTESIKLKEESSSSWLCHWCIIASCEKTEVLAVWNESGVVCAIHWWSLLTREEPACRLSRQKCSGWFPYDISSESFLWIFWHVILRALFILLVSDLSLVHTCTHVKPMSHLRVLAFLPNL